MMDEKIISRLFKYLENKGIPHTRFEKEIGLSNGYLKTQLRRNADLGEGVIRKIIDNCLDINLDWLLIGKGDMLIKSNSDVQLIKQSNVNKSTGTLEFPVIASNEDDLIKIPIVDIDVAAGSGSLNSDHLSEVDVISLPRYMLKTGRVYLCVRIKGLSMFPTLQDGGFLIISSLDPGEWRDIRDGYVYVVSDREGRTFVKRIKNRLVEHGFIVCNSDNLDPMQYPSFNIYENEINTVWYTEWYFTAKIPNVNDTYYNKVSHMEESMDSLRNEVNSMQSQLRTLLRKN